MVVNQLLPVPISSVEESFSRGQYPVRVVQRDWYGEDLDQVVDERRLRTLQPELFFSDARGKTLKRTAHRSGYPFMYHRGFGVCGQAQSSMKSAFRPSGTYDVNGEIITAVEEKGLYINHFS